MNDTSEDDLEEVSGTPPDVCEKAENDSLDLLPAKSRSMYERCYRTYKDWKKSSQITSSSSERVLMVYFNSLAKNYQPSTLWSYYSMLKTTIMINEKLDISKYRKLSAFMKKQSRGFQSKKSKVFSSEEVKRFLTEAPDEKYLLTKVSPDQGYGDTPGHETSMIPEWMHRRSDHIDASPNGVVNEEYQTHNGTPSGITAAMPVTKTAERYNMSHPNRGKCLIFNHEVFETGFSKREGSTVDAKRIKATFTNLGFEVVIHDNLEHSDVLDEIKKLSGADHTDNDCVCVFVLTHGLNNDLLMAKDAAYRSDKIWKPFTADNCPTLAGKPKLFFYQACRGDKLDGGITLMARSGNTQTDSAIASYKIPTHSDFLIAHSSVDGFFSWRNPEEGTWYVQCLCSVLDQFAATTDLLKMLTITARRVATEFQSYDDINVQKNEQKQVPSTTSMLIRDLYFTPK